MLKMNTGGTDRFPQVGDRIQPDHACAVTHISQKNINELQQHLRIGKIQVNLVLAECCPDMTHTTVGIDLSQQRAVARARHLAQIRVGGHFYEVAIGWRNIGNKVGKPQAFT